MVKYSTTVPSMNWKSMDVRKGLKIKNLKKLDHFLFHCRGVLITQISSRYIRLIFTNILQNFYFLFCVLLISRVNERRRISRSGDQTAIGSAKDQPDVSVGRKPIRDFKHRRKTSKTIRVSTAANVVRRKWELTLRHQRRPQAVFHQRRRFNWTTTTTKSSTTTNKSWTTTTKSSTTTKCRHYSDSFNRCRS